MQCPACHVEVVPQSVYCHKCGHSLREVDPAKAGTPAAPAPEKAQPLFKPAADTAEESEKELWQGGYSPKAMIGAWVISGLITILLLIFGFWWGFHTGGWLALLAGIVLLWLYQLGTLAYRRLSIHYVLTNQRLIHEVGVLRRLTDRMQVLEIDDVTLEQGLIERMMGTGTIRISAQDRTHPELLLRGIENAPTVAGLIDDVRRRERNRKSVYVEQI